MNHIWTYWEYKDKSNRKRPEYLELCKESLLKHNQTHFQIHFLDETTICKYIGDEIKNKNLDVICSIPQKTDYYRLLLLKKYGGIWIDSDIIFFQSMKPYFDRLVNENYDYIGFGCYYQNCEMNEKYPKPANWVMIAKKNSTLIQSCLKEVEFILSKYPSWLKNDYHCLGKHLIGKHVQYLRKHDSSWAYHHVSSKCVERDSNGLKITNQRMISTENVDQQCISKMIFIPVYNTAPGFPLWFLNMSKSQLLKANLLISKFFRVALRYE
jgi:hypothetical protein